MCEHCPLAHAHFSQFLECIFPNHIPGRGRGRDVSGLPCPHLLPVAALPPQTWLRVGDQLLQLMESFQRLPHLRPCPFLRQPVGTEAQQPQPARGDRPSPGLLWVQLSSRDLAQLGWLSAEPPPPTAGPHPPLSHSGSREEGWCASSWHTGLEARVNSLFSPTFLTRELGTAVHIYY